MVDERDNSSEDDPLEDLDLDDAELDSLLEEVEPEANPSKTGSQDSAEGQDSSESLLSESDLLGEDDLLDDDIASSDVGDLMSEIPDTVPEDVLAELDGDDDVAPNSASDDDADFTDILGDDLDGDDLDGDDLGGDDGSAPGQSADPLADDDLLDDPTDLLEDAAVPAAAVGDAEEKPAGSKLGDGSKAKKGFASKATRARGAARKGKKSKDDIGTRQPPAPPKGRTLTFVCSECYTEVSVAANHSEERVTCPDCLHVGKKPDDNFLRTVSLHKSGERKKTVLTTLVGFLMVLSFLALVYMRSAYPVAAGEFATEDLETWTMVFLGAGGVFSILFMILLFNFEKNRWEVYF